MASLTIPSVIANYNREQTGIKLKKAYTTLSQAIQQSSIVNGNLGGWDYTLSETNFAEKYFVPYLKISKNCGMQNNKNCFVHVKPLDNNVSHSSTSDYMPGYSYKILLSDGTSVKFNKVGSPGAAYSIMVDINGLKNPNILGKDIFSFYLVNSNQYSKYLLNSGSGNLIMHRGQGKPILYPDGYGYDFASLFSSDDYRGCTKAAPKPGPHCTAVIMQNNWKIPDKKEYKKMCPNCPESDYPW